MSVIKEQNAICKYLGRVFIHSPNSLIKPNSFLYVILRIAFWREI